MSGSNLLHVPYGINFGATTYTPSVSGDLVYSSVTNTLNLYNGTAIVALATVDPSGNLTLTGNLLWTPDGGGSIGAPNVSSNTGTLPEFGGTMVNRPIGIAVTTAIAGGDQGNYLDRFIVCTGNIGQGVIAPATNYGFGDASNQLNWGLGTGLDPNSGNVSVPGRFDIAYFINAPQITFGREGGIRLGSTNSQQGAGGSFPASGLYPNVSFFQDGLGTIGLGTVQAYVGMPGGLTWESNDFGSNGNSITIEYRNDGTLGSEYISQESNNFVVHIATGQTTNAGILLAYSFYVDDVAGVGLAFPLPNPNAQLNVVTAQGPTPLTNGLTNTFMRPSDIYCTNSLNGAVAILSTLVTTPLVLGGTTTSGNLILNSTYNAIKGYVGVNDGSFLFIDANPANPFTAQLATFLTNIGVPSPYAMAYPVMVAYDYNTAYGTTAHFSSNGSAIFDNYVNAGTYASPAYFNAGNILAIWEVFPYAGSAYGVGLSYPANSSFRFQATEDQSSSNQGTEFIVTITATGGTGGQDVLSISNAGNGNGIGSIASSLHFWDTNYVGGFVLVSDNNKNLVESAVSASALTGGPWLPLAGGQMSGSINMGNNVVVGDTVTNGNLLLSSTSAAYNPDMLSKGFVGTTDGSYIFVDANPSDSFSPYLSGLQNNIYQSGPNGSDTIGNNYTTAYGLILASDNTMAWGTLATFTASGPMICDNYVYQGTFASPAYFGSGNALAIWNVFPNNANGLGNGLIGSVPSVPPYSNPAPSSFRFQATEDQSSSAQGTQFIVSITPTGTTTAQDTLSVSGAGIEVLSGHFIDDSFSGSSVVLISNTSKNIVQSSITATTLSYLDATSSIQTQLNSKLVTTNNLSDVTSAATAFNNISPMTTVGDTIYEAAGPIPTRLPIGTTGQVYTVVAGLPAWVTPASGANITLSNLTSPTAINQSLLFGTDNAFAIGASGANRPSAIYSAGPGTFVGQVNIADANNENGLSITGAQSYIGWNVNNTNATTGNYLFAINGDSAFIIYCYSTGHESFGFDDSKGLVIGQSLAYPQWVLGAALTLGGNNGGGNSDLVWFTDGDGSIGASGANRPANIFLSNSITTPIVYNTAAQTTITGTVGTAMFSQPEQGVSYKKVIIYLNGYTNTGTQNYTFPTAFVNTPVAVYTTAGAVATIGTTTVSIVSTATTGFVILEGY
jgi:hypothetical protein